jgi:tetratricopeptide (TPR) repeat protein
LAYQAWEANPKDADATIWLGRRYAYLGEFRAAIAVFSGGIADHPTDARMYRHRGHRYITVRDFHAALADLERARQLVRGKPDEVEPDGLPNKSGVPLETLNSNIYYHLGLAQYLLGDFARALITFKDGRTWCKNADNICSMTHWMYMAARRTKNPSADVLKDILAPISADMPVVEYHAYHELCMAYAGLLDIDQLYEDTKAAGTDSVDFATIGYGVGNWHLANGDKERALAIFHEVEAGPQWHAFGHVAAEVELARVK